MPPVVADGPGAGHLPGLLVRQQELQLLGPKPTAGGDIVGGGGLPIEGLARMPEIVGLDPLREGGVDRGNRGRFELLQDEVPLDELEEPLDLPLGPRPAGVHEMDPEPAPVVLVVRLAEGAGGLELAPPIREEPLGQPPAGEGRGHDREEVDPELPEEDAARQDEAAVVVQGEDQVEIPEQREADLPPEVDLPQLVRRGRHEALNRLHRRLAESAQPMADRDQPDRLPRDRQPEKIPELPGGAMRPGSLGIDDCSLLGRGEPGAPAPRRSRNPSGPP